MRKRRRRLIDAARGLAPADVVFSNAVIFNPFSCTWEEGSLAVTDGIVVGIGTYCGRVEHDLHGARIVPGLIDAHVHIESSLLTPKEYARLVATHGTTTVIADPHEIANVAGATGLDFMVREAQDIPIDILYMLPSCVPATPRDMGGGVLTASDLARFIGRPGVLGIGEVMNVPGVLAQEKDLLEKIALAPIVDGHAPLLSGADLNAYLLSGMQSDHECTRREEAEEKLRRGMYIFLREGSTERNIGDLAGIVTPCTAPRCCFATDDCHADMLAADGHIDNCVRTAIAAGLEPEIVLRMATLSAAERFRLFDRGALAPGRLADFCVIDDCQTFTVKSTFKRGVAVGSFPPRQTTWDPLPFACAIQDRDAIRISGCGRARVIGIVPHQIITDSLRFEVDARDIPDLDRDILKAVVCNRYNEHPCGIGLVHGFGFARGAIAASVAHDAHNIVAVGVRDQEIVRAINAVIHSRGAMVIVDGKDETVLPLECAGLMSLQPFEKVVSVLERMKNTASHLGAISEPFMYLSFLSLTVIPNLRLTDRGLFDVGQSKDVSFFVE
jgi:adenine deaminase